MVQVDIALSAAVGATLALGSRRRLRNEPRLWTNPRLSGAVVFAAVVMLPWMLGFLTGWPAWDTLYVYDAAEVPAWLAPAFAFTSLVAAGLGFVITHAVIRGGHEKLAFGVPAVFVVPVVAVLVAMHDRALHVGSKASLAAGAEVNLFESGLVWMIGVGIPVGIGVPLVAVLVWVQRVDRAGVGSEVKAPDPALGLRPEES